MLRERLATPKVVIPVGPRASAAGILLLFFDLPSPPIFLAETLEAFFFFFVMAAEVVVCRGIRLHDSVPIRRMNV